MSMQLGFARRYSHAQDRQAWIGEFRLADLGKRFQDVALSTAGKMLPPSPYTADALSFARRVAAGENMQTAALSVAGKRVLHRMQR